MKAGKEQRVKDIYGRDNNLKQQWEKLKWAPFKEKLGWFLHYFGVYLFVVLVLSAVLVMLLITMLRPRPQILLNGIFYDAEITEEQKDALYEELAEKLEAEESAVLKISDGIIKDADAEYLYYEMQALTAQVAAKDLDMIGGRGDSLDGMVSKEDPDGAILSALEEVLPEKLCEALKQDGRIRSFQTAQGEKNYLILASDSHFAEVMGLRAQDYWVAFSCTAPHTDTIIEVVKMILEPAS